MRRWKCQRFHTHIFCYTKIHSFIKYFIPRIFPGKWRFDFHINLSMKISLHNIAVFTLWKSSLTSSLFTLVKGDEAIKVSEINLNCSLNSIKMNAFIVGESAKWKEVLPTFTTVIIIIFFSSLLVMENNSIQKEILFYFF
jgi:hypothetical protein